MFIPVLMVVAHWYVDVDTLLSKTFLKAIETLNRTVYMVQIWFPIAICDLPLKPEFMSISLLYWIP